METITVGGALGALVEGVSLRDLDEPGFAELHRALLDHQVLFLRDQHLSDDELLGLTRRFGEPMPHPVGRLLGQSEAIGTVEDREDKPPAADSWHSDITYWPAPPKIGLLCALSIPDRGGDTMWSSLYAAYGALSEPVRRLCDGLTALHAPNAHFVRSWCLQHGERWAPVIEQKMAGAVLPLVRTHDETGRQALFSSGGMRIQELTETESAMLVGHLREVVADPNHTVRWRWSEGDVAIWDERCTNHRALSDHYPRHRLMRRCTVQGDTAFHRPDGSAQPTFVAHLVGERPDAEMPALAS